MSSYLGNLARRGAGLAPVMAPRAEVSPVIPLSDPAPFSEPDQGGLETFPVSEKTPAPSGSLEPATGALLPARPHPPVPSPEGEGEKRVSVEFEVRSPRQSHVPLSPPVVSVQRHGGLSPIPEDSPPIPAPREQEISPELPAASPVQRVTPEPERSLPAAALASVAPTPRPEPPRVTVPVPLPESVPPAEPSATPKVENPSIPEPQALSAPQASLALSSPRTPEPALPPRPRAEPVAPEPPEPAEPRIEVRIGRVELRTAPPPAPPPAPSRERRGFEDHALARRYLRRKWY